MSTLVVDASVAIEYLLLTPTGEQLVDTLEEAILIAPELIDVEVFRVLRSAVLDGRLAERRARTALEDLAEMPMERLANRTLVPIAWEHRHNVSATDAFYVAAARLRNAPLITADGRLSRAPGLGITIHHVHISRPTG